MLTVAMTLGIATSVVFGLYPAFQGLGTGLTSALRDQSSQTTAGRSTGVFRNGLVAVQAAVSVPLLVSAGLLGKTC
jgi:hypothetical protein